MKRTKRRLCTRRTRYPVVLPSYLLAPNSGNVVFDRSLQRARDKRTR